MYDATRWERFITRHRLTRAHLLLVGIFWRGHPERSYLSMLLDYTRGVGPAAVAAGRTRLCR